MKYFRAALAAGAVAATLGAIAPARSASEVQWVDAWAVAPDSAGPPLPAQTVRQIVRTSIGGSSVRIRLSNLFGTAPLTIGAVHLARHGSGSAIRPGTDHALRFAGKSAVTIAPGADVLSDPLALPLAALDEITVSLYLPAGAKASTVHGDGMQTAFITPGNAVAAASFPAGKTSGSRFLLTDVEVAAGAEARTIVAIGDSVTDGHGSGRDHNARWTDALAARLQADPALASIAVANAGISGNRLLNDGPIGPSMLGRFDRDVLGKPGLAWVVLDAGLNDIGLADDPDSPADNVSAQQIIDGMKTLIERAHAKGIRIIGATLLPYAGAEDPLRYSAAGEAKRQAVNAWIRGTNEFDAVVDFEAVTRDPAQWDRLLPAFDSGDHIHPNDAGYQAMAASISLRLFVEMPRHPGT